jgi:cytosine/adenosine deaminase-related metal-dependent hydrolase
MRTALFTERILLDDPTTPQPEDVLEWATLGSARALHMEDSLGSLEVGKKADLFIVNTQRPHLVPTMRIVSGFIHNGQPGDIESVMVDGTFLMRDGMVLTVDEEEIVKEADRIGRRAWRRLVERYPDVPFPVDLAP